MYSRVALRHSQILIMQIRRRDRRSIKDVRYSDKKSERREIWCDVGAQIIRVVVRYKLHLTDTRSIGVIDGRSHAPRTQRGQQTTDNLFEVYMYMYVYDE